MSEKKLIFTVLAGASLFITTSLSADPQSAPAAPGKAAGTNAELSPEQMGAQLEKMLQDIVKTGNDASKKAYGIDLEQEMGVAKNGQPLAPAANAGTAPGAAAASGTDAQMIQGVFQNSTDIVGKSMGVLGKMAEMDLKEMQGGEGSGRVAPQTENARKAEELTGQGTLKAMTGDTEGSITLFQQAIVLNPEFGTAYYNLACAYARLGANDKFAAPLQKAIAIDAKYKGMAERDSDFDTVRKSKEYQAIGKR